MSSVTENTVTLALSNKIYRKRLERHDQYRDLSDKVLGDLVTKLRDERASLDPSELASKDEILLPLLELERAMPLDPANYIPPSCYDVLITDIDDNDLKNIAAEVGIEQYSASTEPARFPVDGIIYGDNSRLFVPLTVEKKGTRIHVMFLFDPGSPHTYLRKETWSALGYQGDVEVPSTTSAKVHDQTISVSLSREHFENVDLLGQNFMDKLNLEAAISHRHRKVRLYDDDILFTDK